MKENRILAGRDIPHKAVRLISYLTIACLVFVAIPLMPDNGTYAASSKGTLKATTIKWSKKAIDTTTAMGNQKVALTIKFKNTLKHKKVKKNIKYDYYFYNVVLKNSVTKKTKKYRISTKKGNTANISFSPDKSSTGTWKVSSITSYYGYTYYTNKYRPGYWDSFGKWHPKLQLTANGSKKLKTIKPKSPGLKVTRGAETTLSVNAPQSQPATKTTADVSATLKSNGKAVAGENITFTLRSNADVNASRLIKMTISTDGTGKATANFTKVMHDAKDLNNCAGFTVTARYAGKSGKSCQSSKMVSVTQPKVKTRFGEPALWYGNDKEDVGIEVVVKETMPGGPEEETPVVGMPIIIKQQLLPARSHALSGAKTPSGIFERQGWESTITQSYPTGYALLSFSNLTTTFAPGIEDHEKFNLTFYADDEDNLDKLLAFPYAPPGKISMNMYFKVYL